MPPPIAQRKEWIRSRRERRKGAKTARLRRQFLRYVLLATLLWAGLFIFQNTSWTVANAQTDVVVQGNQVTSSEQIRAKVEQYLNVPLYKVEPQTLEGKVTELATIKYAFVRRYALPKPRLVIEVLEECPWATLSSQPDGPAEAVIAQSGRIIPIDKFPKVQQPELKIYGPKNCSFSSAEVSQWASWVAYIASQTKQPVVSIDIRKPSDIIVVDGDLILKLGNPDTTLTRRLGRLSSVMSAIEPLRNRLEYVDLGLDNNIPLKLAKKSGDLKQSI